MKTTIYVTRHGETQWNVEGKMQGWHDSPLTEQGIRQAVWLRDALQHIEFEAIYSSSSPRASKTAEILRHRRTGEVICHDALREVSLGDWEGQAQREIQQKDAVAYTAFWETPHLYHPENGGESYYDVQRRVLPFLNAIVTKQEGKTLLIVTHAVVLKIILSHFEERPLAHLWQPPFIHPTALCKIVVENQHPSIELYGDTSHYRERDQ